MATAEQIIDFVKDLDKAAKNGKPERSECFKIASKYGLSNFFADTVRCQMELSEKKKTLVTKEILEELIEAIKNDPTISVRQFAKKHGFSHQQLYKQLRNKFKDFENPHRTKWDKIRILRLKQLRNSKNPETGRIHTFREIAKILGEISAQGVRAFYERALNNPELIFKKYGVRI